jgi:hypothetical protein
MWRFACEVLTMTNQRERRNQNKQLNRAKERDNYSQIRTIKVVKPEIEDSTVLNIYYEAKKKDPKLTFERWLKL